MQNAGPRMDVQVQGVRFSKILRIVPEELDRGRTLSLGVDLEVTVTFQNAAGIADTSCTDELGADKGRALPVADGAVRQITRARHRG